MTNPLSPYGFDYEYNGKSFAFHIVAASQQEAEARLASMAGAKCVGELKEAERPSRPGFRRIAVQTFDA